jgi:hypothetical protein
MKAKTMIYLEPAQLAALRARARAERVSLAEVVRRAVQASLDAEPTSPRVAASRYADLVGLGRSGRADLGDRHDEALAAALGRRRVR